MSGCAGLGSPEAIRKDLDCSRFRTRHDVGVSIERRDRRAMPEHGGDGPHVNTALKEPRRCAMGSERSVLSARGESKGAESKDGNGIARKVAICLDAFVLSKLRCPTQ